MWYWGKRLLPGRALWSENHILKLHISLTQTLKKCKHIASIYVVHDLSCCSACNKSIRNEAIPECSLAISLGVSENFFPCLQIYITPQRFSRLFCLADAAHYYFPPFSFEERALVGKFYNSQKQVLFISYNVMQTLLTYLNWANGASQMDCTSRLLFPSLGLRNKIRTYNHHGEWQPLYRRSSGPALPLGGLVAQLCGCLPLREKNHRTVLWQCWPDNSW